MTITRKIKIEINTREHFTHFPKLNLYYEINSAWYSNSCNVVTYDLDELAGTKLRALYQRRKGRDLFDLDMLIREKMINENKFIEAFKDYIGREGLQISKSDFLRNLDDKLQHRGFIHDMDALIIPGYSYDIRKAADNVRKLIGLIN